MATYPPPPPGTPYGYDPKTQARAARDQARNMRDQIKAQRRAQKQAFQAQRDLYRQQARAMRRSSILGPLLLVAIGVVFLLIQTGRISFQNAAELYSRWWPLLFVAAGVIVLAEWGIDMATQREDVPLGRRSVGGGVVFLLILLAIGGAAIHIVHTPELFAHSFGMNPDNWEQFLGQKHEGDQTMDMDFRAGSSLVIDNPHGDTTVSGTSTDNQIHITVHKTVYSTTDTTANQRLQQLDLSCATIGNAFNISVPTIEGASSDITVTVPDFAGTTVTTNRGDVHVDSIRGNVSVTANHGDVDLSAITGDIVTRINNNSSDFAAHTVTGSVELRGHAQDISLTDVHGPVTLEGEFYGSTHLEHLSSAMSFKTSRTELRLARLDGELDISSDSNLSVDQAAGPFVLNTRNRNITLDRVAGDISITNRNGKVDLTAAPPTGNINIENRNDSVSVTVPENAGYTVQADTQNGDVENEFDLAHQENGRHNSLSGKIGAGGPTLRISTTQGDVSLHKASIPPIPPAPPAPPKLTAIPVPPKAPTPPEPPTGDAQRALAEARKAQQEANKAVQEAERQAREAQRQAKEALRQAQKATSNQ